MSMKITRNINGQTVEIELTAQEIWKAYHEEKVKLAYEDIELYLHDNYDDNDEPRPELDEQDKEDIVEEYLENKDCMWSDWMQMAFEHVVL
jgi:hypothetical protein